MNLERVVEVWRQAAAEFTAATLLVFMGSATTTINEDQDLYRSTIQLYIGHFSSIPRFGIALMCLAMVQRPRFASQPPESVSGGNMNPAVTLAAVLVGRLDVLRGCVFFCMQILGSTLGAGLAHLIAGQSSVTSPSDAFSEGGGSVRAMFIESMVTTLLVVTFLSLVEFPTIVCYGVGMAVSAGSYASYDETGGSLNPARSFGSALVEWWWNDQWIYWTGPLMGSCFGALLWKFVVDGSKKEEEQSSF